MPTFSSSISNREFQALWASKLSQSYYQDDQQAKFMHLQAEVECLLQQLQNLKRERLDSHSQDE